jgi:hypothetical protein
MAKALLTTLGSFQCQNKLCLLVLACACLCLLGNCDHKIFIAYMCIHVIGQAMFEISKQVQASRACKPFLCKSRLLGLA